MACRPSASRSRRPAPIAAAASRGERSRDPVALLAVGAVVPRKGYDVLIEALAGLLDLPWRLTIVGDCAPRPRDGRAAQGRHRAPPARRRASRIEDAVPAERLAALYAAADLFVLPSRYEGFGMAYAEAIAHGLPVIGTTAGAIPETVPAQAGVLVPPDDVAALAAALRRLIESRAERARLAAGARAAAAQLPTWRGSAELFSQAHREGAMSGSRPSWLDAARALRPARAQRAPCSTRSPPGRRERPSVAVVDLACGLGSTLRAVSERLPRRAELAAGRQRSEPARARRRRSRSRPT